MFLIRYFCSSRKVPENSTCNDFSQHSPVHYLYRFLKLTIYFFFHCFYYVDALTLVYRSNFVAYKRWRSTLFFISNANYPAGNYLFKVNNKDTRTTLCQRLYLNEVTGLKPATLLQKRFQNDVVLVLFFVNFERISYLVLVFLRVNFEQVNVGCVVSSTQIVRLSVLNVFLAVAYSLKSNLVLYRKFRKIFDW